MAYAMCLRMPITVHLWKRSSSSSSSIGCEVPGFVSSGSITTSSESFCAPLGL